MTKKYLQILLLILWMGIIFTVSHIPSYNLPFANEQSELLRDIKNNTAHVIEYGILSFLFYSVFIIFNLKLNKKNIFYLAIFFSVMYAFSDEYHQSFIAGREASINDIGFDSIGAFLGAFLYKIKLKKLGIRK